MSVQSRAFNPALPSTDPRALALWEFVRREKPWFTPALAAELLEGLPPPTDVDAKELARWLQQKFAARNIKLKLTHAQQAIARVLGKPSWHLLPIHNAVAPRLLCRQLGAADGELYEDWASVKLLMQACITRWAEADPTKVYWVGLVDGTLVLSALEPRGHERAGETVLLEVVAAEGVAHWLDGAATALEGLRRFVENDAILDGFAALSAYLRISRADDSLLSFDDIGNAELVVLRGGAEFARGDELGCWLEIEHSRRSDARYGQPLHGDVVFDGQTWLCGAEALTWHVYEVRKGMVGVGGSRRPLGVEQAASLFRRYQRARRIFKEAPPTRGGKRLLGLRTPSASLASVDLRFVEQAFAQRGLGWPQFAASIDEDVPALTGLLPSPLLPRLAKFLKLEDPSRLFVTPAPSEFIRVASGEALRAYYCAADSIKFGRPAGATPDVARAIENAIENFANVWEMGKSIANGTTRIGGDWQDAPHQAYAAEVDEFVQVLGKLGMAVSATFARSFILRTGKDIFEHQDFPYRDGLTLLVRIAPAQL
ncbi:MULTISPECIES: hypothetical protein [unclassified Variovorax]|uniref:hypothetical protein n=1 Tax=unclassified Variovorax TaxID=663243 RepID=UPI001317E636|nr:MULTISPECIES: hypothetical protein [unclassified Variovorax]VTU42828.1 hypothetical protein H6P1_00289 [Variovorax sp. PBL-H6]VTU43649.1 hypothetical protein SRS16P1_00615 [Variovorax sp. SRS16]VTU43713.1 hypothetical protein E5P1_00609 [Variovorax sp. PBL-E5]